MTRFYTRKGDDGYTGVLGPGRIPKHHLRIEAIGCIDEAMAAIGMARVASQAPQINTTLITVQQDLYHMMAEAAALPENAEKFRKITPERVNWLEEQTEAYSQEAEVPNEFILPGDSPGGAAAALARTSVRRAERRVAELLHARLIENPDLLRYLNRLSSLLFVIELIENQAAGKTSPTLAKGNTPS